MKKESTKPFLLEDRDDGVMTSGTASGKAPRRIALVDRRDFILSTRRGILHSASCSADQPRDRINEDLMSEHYRYQGHSICIELFEVMPRQFRWKWTVDGVHSSRSRNVLASESVARSEAFLYAQVMVARLRNRQAQAA